MSKTLLTHAQTALLDALFGAADGDFDTAVKMAGYEKNTPLDVILGGNLKDAIIERAKTELALGAPKAAKQLVSLLSGIAPPDAKIKLAAIIQVLDRTNIVKTDLVQVDTKGGLFILPSKDELLIPS